MTLLRFAAMVDGWRNLDSSQAPTPAAALFTLYSDAPSQSPSIRYTNTPTYDNVSTDNSSSSGDVSLLRFSVYLVFTFLVLALILYMSRAGPPPTGASVAPTTDANAQEQQAQQAAKSMSLEERREYVMNFLKTQKFVDENYTSIPPGSSSFRVKQSSSYRITREDDDLESCLSFEYPNCAICLDRFKEGEDICSAQNKNCRHEFHLECIFPWLLKSQDCPCCRRDYLTVENDTSERGGGGCGMFSSNRSLPATPPSATPAVNNLEEP